MSDVQLLYRSLPSVLNNEIAVAPQAVQCSPRVPGAKTLESFAEQSCESAIVHAPASTVERRYVLAHALRSLKAGGQLTALAANTKGGMRLSAELSAFGCRVATMHKRKHQIVRVVGEDRALDLAEALAAGAPQLLPDVGLWSQPGLFSWDRIDPGSELLLPYLTNLNGTGADLGCGIGLLARAALQSHGCKKIFLADIDRRAVEMARRNVPDERASFVWADVLDGLDIAPSLDFAVANPPFHDGGVEDQAIGRGFISRASGLLKAGGEFWLTANRHLAYEATLRGHFETIDLIEQARGYKIYRAVKGAGGQQGRPSQRRRS